MNQLKAVLSTLTDWAGISRPTLKNVDEELPNFGDDRAVEIVNPGGTSQIRTLKIPSNATTTGYNIARRTKHLTTTDREDIVEVSVSHFAINFADVCIRLGLYESAIRNVGYPIIPGFDISGTITSLPPSSNFKIGQRVYGATLFGGYTTKLSIPINQIRVIPDYVSNEQAAALPAVSLTALHALMIAGFPVIGKCDIPLGKNKSILIHSASGGVGGMLVQFAKLCGVDNVVGVVGRKNKVEYAISLGCDKVVYKEGKGKKEWWKEVEEANNGVGYKAIFDANGVETLQTSYDHLDMCGRLVVYGFHTNLDNGTSLSPLSWLRMIVGFLKMPRFDAMQMTLDSRAVLGFNLSFFENETELIGDYFDTITKWLEEKKFQLPKVNLYEMDEVAQTHELIQSGKSIGKIVVRTNKNELK
ncbi:hypothetical protein TrLO_g4917 [Triparma laevis f. longispina]|uniref:Enoyl reductase (ER) domain-containing protein n=1 Tax=Triparma laevis f. longispina TaxID=1714387 RepID=A0A9W7C936_9STRA|nr:hypothetical protein TrLO_g4917 [Triparma laevis f. longispina]